MKIVLATPFYAPDWQWGGVVTWAAQLFPALARRGHQVTVVTTQINRSLAPEEEIEGVQVIRVPGEVLGSSGRVRSDAYKKACQTYFAKADVVHLAGIWQPTGHTAARMARSMGIRFGVSPHGALGPYAWTSNRILKMAWYCLRERGHLAHAAWIHATSPMEQKELHRLGWARHVHVVPNPLDVELWGLNPEDGKSWRNKLGASDQEFVLLSCGRIHHKKGLDILPRALAEAGENWKWVVIGDDRTGMRAVLQSHLKKSGLEEKVTWLDAVRPSDVRAAYAGSDCLLMPSLHENFGNVAVEAAACGCRALVSDKVGASAWLEDPALPRETAAWSRGIRGVMAAGRDSLEIRHERSCRMRELLAADRVAEMFEKAMLKSIAS